jgi:hypothetical protein
MPFFVETAINLTDDADILRRRRFGVIDVRNGQLVSIRLRSWPKFVSIVGVAWGQLSHAQVPGDWLRLYYNQPFRYPDFLALKFAISARNTTLDTVHRALAVLDEIARIKGSDALLCDAANFRLSPAMLARFGWEPHAASRWHRNYIKRFYGQYPRLWQPVERQAVLARTA